MRLPVPPRPPDPNYTLEPSSRPNLLDHEQKISTPRKKAASPALFGVRRSRAAFTAFSATPNLPSPKAARSRLQPLEPHPILVNQYPPIISKRELSLRYQPLTYTPIFPDLKFLIHFLRTGPFVLLHRDFRTFKVKLV